MPINRCKKKEIPELDEKTASKILENILETCGAEPSSIPLSELTSNSSGHRERFLPQKILVASILLFICLVPALLVVSNIELNHKNKRINENLNYELEINTPFPVSRITASINEKSTPIFESDNKTYSIKSVPNGFEVVCVPLKNRSSSTKKVEEMNVDTASSNLLSNKTRKNSFYLYLSELDSNIDYTFITASDSNGNAVQPVSYNESQNYVVFSKPNTSLNIYIPDKTGNNLHLILTVR